MNRYDKRQVMKDAHRIYKNDFQRKGRSWGECLKAAPEHTEDCLLHPALCCLLHFHQVRVGDI